VCAFEGRGQVVILNGVPRSGKTSICRALQERGPGVWVNLGVDASERSIPERLRPGVGLRPGGERPDLENAVVLLYDALFDSVAAHARLGLDVVVDVGLHDAYSRPLGLPTRCGRRLEGLPVLFVGVRCPLDVVWERRRASWGQDGAAADDDLRAAVERWQEAVHAQGPYDLDLDTSELAPAHCADIIVTRLADGPPGVAFARLAALELP
jgi:chloramphenicol 3-O phosphotransferase